MTTSSSWEAPPPGNTGTPDGPAAAAADVKGGSGGGGATTLSAVHNDVLDAHVLPRLDGPALATVSCCCATLRALSTQPHLWSHICHSTWPSTAAPRVSQVISTFPNGGYRSFFGRAFPFPAPTSWNNLSRSYPAELISAVDVYYKNKLILSRVQETETVTGWFRCSPFRVDLLDPKDVVPTGVKHPHKDDTSTALAEEMTLSWILIDPNGRRAVNLSSRKPVSVERHWLSGEVQVQFVSILAVHQKGPSDFVQCGIVVNCCGSQSEEMQVREVSMEMEDMDGMHLNGKDSLVILHDALEGKTGRRWNSGEEGRKMYKHFLEMKRERRERRLRREGALDVICISFGVTIVAAFWFFCFLQMR